MRANILAIHTLFDADRSEHAGTGLAARGATLSSRIVAEVREALLDGRLKPGDFIGGEKEIGARSGVSRIVARDALRTLEASGVVEIKVGAGGGARIACGNPRLFAEALAVQLTLADVSIGEILDAQRAIECLASELAARNATPADIRALDALCDQAEERLGDADAFTRASLAFHLAVAEASHNRVLVVQLISLQHVAWPRRNRTLTRKVAQGILATHRALLRLIEARDADAARRLMNEHVIMIKGRRVAERRVKRKPANVCC
ncbi:MAG TPA: FCD domain-containing protein [Candidatus Cybelea sp.]|nr:FCD domain-containing protein [Candidatus Cybelea sp.]